MLGDSGRHSGHSEHGHNGHTDTVLCIMDRVPGISGIPRQGCGETDRDLVSCAECQYQPIRGLTTHLFNQSEL